MDEAARIWRDLGGAWLRGKGAACRGGKREFGVWKTPLCMAPDNVLLQLFQIDRSRMPPGCGGAGGKHGRMAELQSQWLTRRKPSAGSASVAE